MGLVLGGAAVVSLLLGFLGYKRYAESERWVAEGIVHMQEVGEALDAGACVDEALTWVGGCKEHDTNAAVCQQAVKLEVFYCLDAAGWEGRAQSCEDHLAEYGDEDSDKWVYAACTARGEACFSKRECACAEAIRAFDSYCRTEGQGVQL